ncbi:Nucleotidylyl transferase [Hesseltinella vesiculosa]|uniref:Nucleotidylyl transferase n=1 Tax=Hesseltinella vesiculosa TaxID=101127 RepID=A0A1X2G2X9_9FUNG|nr:Nucleotidylyl transferase [Hesseltinella vesiculosa]
MVMDTLTCFLLNDNLDTQRLQSKSSHPLSFVDAQQQTAQQVLNEQRDSNQVARTFLLWDQPDTLVLIDSLYNLPSTRYSLDQPHSLDDVLLEWRGQSSKVDLPVLTRSIALSLTLNDLLLDKTHLSLLEQAIVQCIGTDHRLVVLVNVKQFHLTPNWSITTEQQWHAWQRAVTLLYLQQIQVAYTNQCPLFDMTVLFPDLLDPCWMTDMAFDQIFTSAQDTALVEVWNKIRDDHALPSWQPVVLTTIDPPESEEISQSSPETSVTFSRVIVGGTFDHLHAGHKILLTMTALLGKVSMTVGVTDDVILQSKKYKELLEPTTVRMGAVKRFCQTIRPDLEYKVVPIFDPFGPTISEPNLDALVVSQETLSGGNMVNDERLRRNYHPLVLRVIDVVSEAGSHGDQSYTDKISSSWIRKYLYDLKQ